MLQRILDRLKEPLDKRYHGRHPTAAAVSSLRTLSPVLRLATSNDKWSLGVHARHWLEVLKEPPIEPVPKPRRLFVFAAYRGQFTLQLALASLLAWRGHNITFGYLPKLGSPIKAPLKDHETAPQYLRAALSDIAECSKGRIVPVDLTSFVDDAVDIDEKLVEDRAIADTVMCIGREQLDFDDPDVKWHVEHYRELGRQTQSALQGFLGARAQEFDVCLIPNGATFAAAHATLVAKRFGVPVNCYDKFTMRGTRLLSHGRPHVEYADLDLIWSRLAEIGLDDAGFRQRAAREAQRLLHARRTGGGAEWSVQYQKSFDDSTDEVLREIGLSPGQRFALVCSNVPFDAGYYEFTRIFPSMRNWLVSTVRRLLDVGTMPVVVRAHPAEVLLKRNKESAQSILAEAGLLERDGLIVIPGTAKTNTYNLIDACHFGAVFTSTVGFEMAMMGKPVVLSSDVYYGRRGFTHDTNTIEEYLNEISALAEAREAKRLSDKQIEDAQVFFYLLHYAVQWPFPYSKMGDIALRPPAQLVRSGEIQQYLPTLDSFATPPSDFAEDVAEFMRQRLSASPSGSPTAM